MKNLETAIKIASATIFCFYLKMHFFHFNVTGQDFYELHKLSNKIYDDVWESFDAISEQIRALDIYAPASMAEFTMLSAIEEFDEVRPAAEMIHQLLLDNEILIKILNEVNLLSENHIGLQNFIQGRADIHSKWSWMLRATIQ